jgi:hypothetical protein
MNSPLIVAILLILKLGFTIAESTVSNGMDRPCSRP